MNGALKYVGDWLSGQPHGNGTFFMPNGVRFEGQTMSLHRPSTDQKKRRSRLET